MTCSCLISFLDELTEMQRLDADCSPAWWSRSYISKTFWSPMLVLLDGVSAATRQWTFTTPFVLHVIDHSIVISLNCLC